MASYSHLSHIRDAFLSIDLPTWELYAGKKSDRPQEVHKYKSFIDGSGQGLDIEDSLTQLERVLNQISYKGGTATLMLGEKDEAPKRIMHIALSRHTMNEPPVVGKGASEYASIGGAKGIESMVADKMRIYDLEHRLMAAEAPRGSIGSQLIDKILSEVDVNTLVPVAVSMINGLLGGKGANLGAAIMPNQNIQQQSKANQQSDKGEGTEIGGGEEVRLENSVEELLGTIALNMEGDADRMAKFLNKMNEVIKTNPEVLKQLGA